MELREEYKKELRELEQKMIGAQQFANQFPAFADRILANKFTDSFTGKMLDKYRGMYFGWGINRYFYKAVESITNYHGAFEPQFLWNIYINEYSIFGDDYTDTGLREIADKVDVFFYDALNATFYATDDQVVSVLDAIVDWYERAKIKNSEHIKSLKKQRLLEQLEELK